MDDYYATPAYPYEEPTVEESSIELEEYPEVEPEDLTRALRWGPMRISWMHYDYPTELSNLMPIYCIIFSM